MNAIAQSIIDAHGATPGARFGGARASYKAVRWGLKGHAGVLDDTTVTVATDRQWASHAPFGALARAANSPATALRYSIRPGVCSRAKRRAGHSTVIRSKHRGTNFNWRFSPDARCGRT